MGSTLPLLKHFHSGKVRDTYYVPDRPDLLLMVASDRLSTHNVKHTSLIPRKGEILTAQMVFVMRDVLKDVPTHLVAAGDAIWAYLPDTMPRFEPDLAKRAVVVQKRKPHKREFVWRNYLTGSLYKAMQESGKDPYGLNLPASLPLMTHFLVPQFTPTMKSENDEPCNARKTEQAFPGATALTRTAFDQQSTFFHSRGLVLIDQKSEADEIMLMDETGTGDCSRLALVEDVRVGVNPPFADKEVVRQAAERIWGKGPKVPLQFPQEVIDKCLMTYTRTFEMVAGKPLVQFQKQDLYFQAGLE